jgi:hypothetical protein
MMSLNTLPHQINTIFINSTTNIQKCEPCTVLEIAWKIGWALSLLSQGREGRKK